MKSSSYGSRPCAAFTLIELLTVMAIILVLAGLIINIAGSAQYNSAKARAQSEVKAMETALESYKTDNGVYPPDPFTPPDPATDVPTTLLDPHAVSDSNNTNPAGSRYKLNSEYLYQVLSGFPVKISGLPPPTTTTMSTAYMKFSVQQLQAADDAPSPKVVTPTSASMYIADPFGFSYGYSTIYAANVAHNNAKNINTPITQGYNPTFDLWSTAGYGAPGGKSTPSKMASTTDAAANYSTLWVKNW